MYVIVLAQRDRSSIAICFPDAPSPLSERAPDSGAESDYAKRVRDLHKYLASVAELLPLSGRS